MRSSPRSPTPEKGTADVEYDYDSEGRVYQVKDAQTLYSTTSRAPYLFYIADGTRGERNDVVRRAAQVIAGFVAAEFGERAHRMNSGIAQRGNLRGALGNEVFQIVILILEKRR